MSFDFKRHPDVIYRGDSFECYCTPIGHVLACRETEELVIPDSELRQFFGAMCSDPRFAAAAMNELERGLDPAADWRWTIDVECDCAN